SRHGSATITATRPKDADISRLQSAPRATPRQARIRWSTPIGTSPAEPDRQRQRKQMESPEVRGCLTINVNPWAVYL
ncbi:hypothetical protein, partial [uncultured Muribaculum sp.]|uniref:hypothetical protein n=1 Tax=uncultured Muribaculum sp. TaxID=1918613 RepID=UPI00259173C3